MKIEVDGKELFTLSETQKKVIKNDIPSEIFEEDMKRRIHYILMHKYENCMERLKKDWKDKLEEYYELIPTSDEKLAELIFSHPEYKDRSQREKLENRNKKEI